MARNIKATVFESKTTKAKVSNHSQDVNIRPYFVLGNDESVRNVRDLVDVNYGEDSPKDGSLLVYESSSNEWRPTTNLVLQSIDAGEF